MNSLPNNEPGAPADSRDSYGPGEETLRLIATLPAPEGLADRMKAGLRATPASRRILMWPRPLAPAVGWMYSRVARGAAAAAIVCLVAGGGWGIYSHVQPESGAGVIAMPVPGTPSGSGF